MLYVLLLLMMQRDAIAFYEPVLCFSYVFAFKFIRSEMKVAHTKLWFIDFYCSHVA